MCAFAVRVLWRDTSTITCSRLSWICYYSSRTNVYWTWMTAWGDWVVSAIRRQQFWFRIEEVTPDYVFSLQKNRNLDRTFITWSQPEHHETNSRCRNDNCRLMRFIDSYHTYVNYYRFPFRSISISFWIHFSLLTPSMGFPFVAPSKTMHPWT